jgi:hypothetical protein
MQRPSWPPLLAKSIFKIQHLGRAFLPGLRAKRLAARHRPPERFRLRAV